LVGSFNSILDDDFQSDLGWTVVNDPSLTTGAWQRAIPLSTGTVGAPVIDFDRSGRCYVTDNRAVSGAQQYDVDFGPTHLISPVLDLSGTDDPVIQFAEWLYCDDEMPPATDYLDVYLSADDGASWVQTHHIGWHPEWVVRNIHVADYIPLTATVRVRFSVQDIPNNSLTEAGIDAVQVFDVQCQ
jgi:hypothetical protein